MTFRQFLKTIQDEESPDGDFADDFLNDSKMKGKNIISRTMLISVLPLRACREAKLAGLSCVSRWRRTRV